MDQVVLCAGRYFDEAEALYNSDRKQGDPEWVRPKLAVFVIHNKIRWVPIGGKGDSGLAVGCLYTCCMMQQVGTVLHRRGRSRLPR